MRKKDLDSPSTKSALFTQSMEWGRFANYTLKKEEGRFAPPNNWLIVPDRNSTFELYRPFEKWKELLADFISTASKIAPKSPYNDLRISDDEISAYGKEILSFCNRYGLLGISFAEYLEIDDGLDRISKFQRYGGESLTVIHYEFTTLLNHFVEWERFRRSGAKLSDLYPEPVHKRYSVTWEKKLSLTAYPIGLTYSSRRIKPHLRILQMEYTFDSLIQAIQIMLIFNRIDQLLPVRSCVLDECQQPFIPQNPRREFCCTTHQERFKKRQQRSRNKSKSASVHRSKTKRR